MRAKLAVFLGAGLVVLSVGVGASFGQQGLAGRLGQKLDDVGRTIKTGATELGDAVKKRFEVVKNDVQNMGVQSRVYSRLHWDKALSPYRLEAHMLRDGGVPLRGVVPGQATRKLT